MEKPKYGRLAIASPTGVLIGQAMLWNKMEIEIAGIVGRASKHDAHQDFYRFELGNNEYQWIRLSDIVSVGPAKHNNRGVGE